MVRMSRSDFISRLVPEAIRARHEGSPLFPSVRIAQNILETGCNLNEHFNLGGFKVGKGAPNEFWKGSTYTTPTWEVIKGKKVNTVASWRSYESAYHFYKDQDRLFQSVRYARVRAAKTQQDQCDALYLCGYATDPDYAKKIMAIIQASPALLALDTAQLVAPAPAPAPKEDDEYVIKQEDATKIIGFMQGFWKTASTQELKDEIHRLSNEIRKAANLPTT